MKASESEESCSLQASQREEEEKPKKTYSIIPDLATGWKPKHLKIPLPILITYQSLLTTQLLEYYETNPSPLVYLGHRHTNSYAFH